mmetsp:Transcript_30186/g.51710  ORF Transcript_30186/g.51710 Transcript_30186/m.51710 type:complete len:390 (-) Transcript_30186:86-1255(-)
MDQERIFNLQLTVQRLEEELSLYRNGTTAEQLFELMKEQEAEIFDLKSNLLDKDTKLRKLAKSSSEVIAKFEDLQVSHKNTLHELEYTKKIAAEDEQAHNQVVHDLSLKYESLQSIRALEKESYEQLSNDIQARDGQIATLLGEVSFKDNEMRKLTERLQEADVSIAKLQKRCADLVGEKSQKLRLLDDERQEMITHVQDFRKNMTTNLAQRDEVVQRKNEKIKELKLQLSISQQESKMKAQKAAEMAVDRDAFWEQKVLVSNLQSKLEDSQRKIEQLETQRRVWQETKSEFEVTRTKLAHAEEKLSRQQDQAQVKRRALQDATHLHTNVPASTTAVDVGKVTKKFGELNSGLEKPSAKQAIKALSGGSSHGNTAASSAYLGIPIGDLL